MSVSSLAARAATEYFVYDGAYSYDFKCLVFPRDIDSNAEKEYDPVSVPGRNGDILLSNKRFANVTHSYDCIIYENFDTNFANLRDFLMSRSGYCRLSDTFHTDEFYHAYFRETIQPIVWRDRSIGKFTLNFVRKPQRWLVSGEQTVTVRENGSWIDYGQITNPTNNACYPLLYFWGSSLSSGFTVWMSTSSHATSAAIDSTIITLANVTQYPSNLNDYGLYLDMETLIAYSAKQRGSSSTTIQRNYNKFVSLSIGDTCLAPFMLNPGVNDFEPGSVDNITELKVMPRWFRI